MARRSGPNWNWDHILIYKVGHVIYNYGQYGQGDRSGKPRFAPCPFHEEGMPSLAIYADHYHCFGCGAHGPLDDLPDGLESSGGSAPVWPLGSIGRDSSRGDLYERVHEAHRSLLDLKQTLGLYLGRRGMLGSIEAFGLGYENGFLIVPIKGRGGEVQGIIRRAYPETERKTGKRYMIPTGQQAMMYVPSWDLWDAADVSYITFGILDAMSLAIAGLAAGSPTNGKLSFDPKWLDDVRHKIVIVPDRGEEQDAHELAVKLDWRGGVSLLNYEESEKDPNDVLVRRGAVGLKEAIDAADKM